MIIQEDMDINMCDRESSNINISTPNKQIAIGLK